MILKMMKTKSKKKEKSREKVWNGTIFKSEELVSEV